MKRNKLIVWLDHKRKGLMAPCAFLLGFLAALAQVMLTRALMTTFSGHELVFAVVWAGWLAGVAFGAAVMRVYGMMWIAALFIFFLGLIPLTWVGAVLLKSMLGIPAGSVAGIGPVAAGTLILLLPLTMLLGAIFKSLSAMTGDGRRVYGYEALGFVAGGILMTFVFIVPLPHGVALWAQQQAWPGYRVAVSDQTRYGDLMVTERGGQKSFLENGRHLFTSQDALSAEEVHMALLSHPAPKAVFLAGGGFSQGGAEALKHPLERLDYAELDPALVHWEHRELPVTDDPRLFFLLGDPRATLVRSNRAYDVILLNAGDPTSLLAGRFFTREFFAIARRHLVPGGIVSVSISSSENYVNAQGEAYARSVLATLRSVFRSVQVIPGERLTFIASDVVLFLSADLFIQRLKERGIGVQFMDAAYMKDRMSLFRMAQVNFSLKEAGDVSTDAHPVTSLHALIYATTRSGDGFSKLMQGLEDFGWILWVMIPLSLVAGLYGPRMLIPLGGSAVAGFTQMVFQVAVIFMVQSVFGYAYAAIGLLTAGFMLGVFLGSKFLSHVTAQASAWMQVILALCFMGAMYWPAGFLVFPIFAGAVGGIQFAAYCVMAGEANAGKVYAADIIGAAVGALCAGIFLIPLWGMFTTMAFIVMINIVMGMLLRCQPASVSGER